MSAASSLAIELVATSAWQSKFLGDIVDILDSKRKPITKRDRVAGPYRYYGATGVLDWVSGFIFDEPLVLIGEDGAKWGAGDASAFAVSGKTWVNNHAHVLRPHHQIVTDEWLIYYLNAADLTEFISGMTVPKLNQGRLREIPIPIPPLEEQKRIVAVLDQAFAALDRARALAQANEAEVSALRSRYLDDQINRLIATFGRVRVHDIADVKGGKRLPKGQKTDPAQTPYPYISVRDMTEEGTVDTTSVQYISKTNHEAIKRYTISSADIYVSIAGTIGKTGMVPAELDGANLTENAAKLVLRQGWHRDFVYWWTRSGSFTEQAIEQTRTAAQPKLALERLGAIELPRADPGSQLALVESMERLRGSIRTLSETYKEKLSSIAALRQSLLQKAFAGELT